MCNERCLLGLLALLGLCPNFPIFLKLPKLSPSLSHGTLRTESDTRTGTGHSKTSIPSKVSIASIPQKKKGSICLPFSTLNLFFK